MMGSAVLVVKPANLRRLGDVWAAVEAAGATVCKAVMLRLAPQDAKLLSANPLEAFDEGLLSGPVVCLQVLGERVLARLRSQPVKRGSEELGEQGNVSTALRKILTSDFEVTALQMFHLDCAKAEEFLLVYKGVAPHYTTMVQQLCSGPCLAMEIRSLSNPENSALNFKELVGPADPNGACEPLDPSPNVHSSVNSRQKTM
ncbi:hypothetical protein HPB51_023011 [Rhipicephalus microplus]|uniref:Nucleoside diphosphate kinase-like domain-containing protein n=1 Tax=Rhipicephalus microplus TaxID=6941 RepID=A0A9J6D793_RHIMP|nr:hypothetical protein HPB51_023011 [Rhipicephalus microplus]